MTDNRGYRARKHFVTVIAEFKAKGGIDPLVTIWDEDRRFEIQRIFDRAYLADNESGGRGLRYTVQIQNQKKFLWQSDEGGWYVNQYPNYT